MDFFTENQLEILENILDNYNKNTELLCSQEITEDSKKVVFYTKQNATLFPIVKNYLIYKDLSKQIQDLKSIIEEDLESQIKNEIGKLTELQNQTAQTLLHQLNVMNQSVNNVVIEIVNKNNLAQLLSSAVENYCKNSNLEYNVSQKGSGVVITIQKTNYYATLKKLAGNNMSTDGQNVKVFVYKIADIKQFNDTDKLKVEMFRSSGAGGQNINKLSTAIRITHLETNISVVCQDERSQLQNKQKALESIKVKVDEFYSKNINKQIEEQKSEQLKLIKTNIISNKFDFASGSITGNFNQSIENFKGGLF